MKINRVICVLLILILLAIFTSCVGDRLSYDLVLLKVDGNIRGSFFLGTGFIQEEDVYIFMFKDSNGGIRRGYAPSYEAIIYEDNNTNPRIEFNPNNSWRKYTMNWYNKPAFYIPIGSIISNYKID